MSSLLPPIVGNIFANAPYAFESATGKATLKSNIRDARNVALIVTITSVALAI